LGRLDDFFIAFAAPKYTLLGTVAVFTEVVAKAGGERGDTLHGVCEGRGALWVYVCVCAGLCEYECDVK
jgi:hypothetical protein